MLVTSRYVPAAPGAEAAPEASGLRGQPRGPTRDSTAGGPGRPDRPRSKAACASPSRTGDILEEHVQIVVPDKRHYVSVIEVPLAAGLELLNPALATAPARGPHPRSRDTLKPAAMSRLDDKHASTHFETLPKGTWDVYLRTRATAEGTFSPASRRRRACCTARMFAARALAPG